jgi:predicted nicotinamide N-methyase
MLTQTEALYFKLFILTMLGATSNQSGFTMEALVRAMAPLDAVMSALGRECEDARDGNICSLASQECFSNQIQTLWKDAFGPSKKYLRNLVRRYIRKMDACEVEPEADLLLELVVKCSLVSDILPNRMEACYKSFRVREGSPLLHLRTYPQHNDVALRLWEAGGVLVEYLMEHPYLVANKNVIETGAGVGLTGLVLARHCNVKSVCLTDYTLLCLENLRHNIARNWPGPPEVVTYGFLDWQIYASDDYDEILSTDDTFPYFQQADVLLAADVVYDVDAVPALTATVWRFLNQGGSVIFATTFRNHKTFDLFEEELNCRGIQCQYEDPAKIEKLPNIFPIYHIQPRSGVRICTMALARTQC